MTRNGSIRWMSTALYVFLMPWAPFCSAREPPAVGCIDLHNLTGGWRSGQHELLIRSRGESGARLALDATCPEFSRDVELEILAPEGWACPDNHLFIRGGNASCPVTRLDVLTEAELADALRMRKMDEKPKVTLDEITVRAHHWRDIRGTTDYCVDARFLRGWNWSSEGLVVEVSPRRHSGHRFYRVETVGSCTDLSNTRSIRLVARSGGAAVCGHPGDKLLLDDASAGLTTASWAGRSCEISQVTPLPSE